MTNIELPTTLPARAAAQAGPTGVPATLSNPPPAVAALSAGSILHGQVAGHDARGHPLIQTRQGTLAISTNIHLSVGSQVTLQLRSAGSQLHVAILQVDGRPVSLHGQPPPSEAPPAPRAGQAPVPPHPPAAKADPPPAPGQGGAARPLAPAPADDVLTLGQSVRAVVQGPRAGAAPPPATPGATLAQLPPGLALQVRILQIDAPPNPARPSAPAVRPRPAAATGQTPAAPGARAPGPQQPATTTATTAAIPASGPAGGPPVGPAAAQAQGAAHPSGTGSPAPGGAPTVPTAPPGPTPAPGPGSAPAARATTGPPAAGPAHSHGANVIVAVVTGTGPTGQTQVHTPAGRLALHLKSDLPVGTQLRLQLPYLEPGAPTARPAADPAALVRSWPAFEAALRTLAGPGDFLTQAASIPSTVPQPGARLASAMLFFLSALNGGDLSAWLGKKAVHTLGGRGDLVPQLTQDFAQLARLSESAGHDWRFVPLPLFDGQQVQQIRMFFRRRGGRGGTQADGAEATRFIVEVDLARLGELQLDGLVRPRRFDLILRTRRELSEAMRRDITAIFEDANAIGGYVGQIVFQASADWPPMPLEAPNTASAGLVV